MVDRIVSENSVYKDASTDLKVWIPKTCRGLLYLEKCKDERNGQESNQAKVRSSLETSILDQWRSIKWC